MSDTFLLERFAAFYEEVANVKVAIADGRLPAYLARDGQAPASDPMELAAMLSSHLRQRLEAQGKEVRDNNSETMCKAYRMTQYLMAALTDELFILDVAWEGRSAWLHYLLEQKLFRTSSAGRDFFTYAERLLASGGKDALHSDLASVFLIAMELGFKGQYRGSHGAPALASLRQRLLRYIEAFRRHQPGQAMFSQAYGYLLRPSDEKRLAPMARWYRFGGIALLAYLLISTLVWINAVHSFTHSFVQG
jgi:type VI secretion system protein ImpK